MSNTAINPAPKPTKSRIVAGYLLDMARAVPVFLKYKSRTMIELLPYIDNLAIAGIALRDLALKNGAVVECGTWRGGMSAGLMEMGGPERCYYFFDSFEGLPPPKEIDGQRAKEWQEDTTSPKYYDNCSASIEEFRHTIGMVGRKPQTVEVHKGFFENTLPGFSSPSIALLRLDGDWYDSTMACLDKFWDYVLPSGLIILDDYYFWEGCSKALHAFLAKREAPERIYLSPIGGVAFLRKKGR